ncbi:MAG TPA: excinuclease ABC subunit UvrA [Acholeplasma sp.]|jgi:excinuclease ABC subunit A|nr:excinuclease ABC subunit UvrA [Acholeplasma sp.]
MDSKDYIIIKGAKENNLKNINLTLPKNKLIVMTGISGSGKSSLAFDTLYQEGQRRYVESLSSYARQFLGSYEKPNVEKIEGLSPSISIDQRTTSKNPRSTIGTNTEIYDFFRLLYARIGVPYSPVTNEPLTKQTIEEMTEIVLELEDNTKIMIISPVVRHQKGTHKKLLDELKKEGFTRLKIDGEIIDLDSTVVLDKNKHHDIYLVIDRLIIREDIRARLYDSIELASIKSGGFVDIEIIDGETLHFSEHYSVIDSDFIIPDLEPRLFSFNSPIGACPECNGIGKKMNISEKLSIDFEKSINDGGIIPYKNFDEENLQGQALEQACKYYKIDLNTPIKNIDRNKLDVLFYGGSEPIYIKMISSSGRVYEKDEAFEGVLTNLERRYKETSSEWIREWLETFMTESTCPLCLGKRLNKAALSVRVGGLDIGSLAMLSVEEILEFIKDLKLSDREKKIAKPILEEVVQRLTFLMDVGLEYLTLSRETLTLSGGEAQRIRLATEVGSSLTGVLYVLDEPSIGLHQKDNQKLINTLKKMRDLGNTLIVVEHDEETMLQSDYLVDIGPGAGIHGGEVIAYGTPEEVIKNKESITAKYLRKELVIPVPEKRRKINKKGLTVINARENNLKNIDVFFPLGNFICVTGVSGSGKSSLVNECLYKGLSTEIYKRKEEPGLYDKILGSEHIKKIIEISQSPIGRTPRSNPATYTGLFDHIRDLYAETNEAKVRGFTKSRFSFNIKGGRCESCKGDGVTRVSMYFLPDVFVKCDVCGGKRYNRETLQAKYRDKDISDVLDMRVQEALEFFKNHPKIVKYLETLNDVGLGYIKLGQPAPTLSGGEAQRVKLASELHKQITSETLYILDEPTTGLHSHDVKKLIKVINKIVDEGATVIIIEHNLDVIKNADYVIDLGPNGGSGGGYIVGVGTPEELMKIKESYTGEYLKKVLK